MDTLVQNTTELRSYNTKKIIDYLKQNDSATKKELSNQLNLCFATVSNICNQLIADGILKYVSSQHSSGGRIPKLLSINASSRYTFCLNLTEKDRIHAAIVNLKNDIVASEKEILPCNATFDDFMDIMGRIYKKMCTELRIDSEKLLGVGVAAPGIMNRNNGCLVNSTNILFENVPLQQILEDFFNLPINIENESNLLVVAESLFGPTEVLGKDMIYLFVGEGLGVGIISNKNVLTGSRGLGGEISHIPVGERQFPCACGHFGCAESELALQGFLRKYQSNQDTALCFTTQCWEEFVAALFNGDANAQSVMAENGRILGKLLSILINLFDPQVIYIGGITEKIFDFLYPHIVDEVSKRVILYNFHEIPIVNSMNYKELIFKGSGELIINSWRPRFQD